MPIAGILSFLGGNWKNIVVILAVIGIFLYWQDRTSTIAEQQDKILELTKEAASVRTHYENEVTGLRTAINQQNDAINKLAEATKKQEEIIRAAQQRGKEIRSDTERQTTVILQSTKPTDATATIDYLVDGVGDLKW